MHTQDLEISRITVPITSDCLVMSLNAHLNITVKVSNTIQNNIICKIDNCNETHQPK